MAFPYRQQSFSELSSSESVGAASSHSGPRELQRRVRIRSHAPGPKPLFNPRHASELAPQGNSKRCCSKLRREKKRTENRVSTLKKQLRDLQREHKELSQKYDVLQLAHGEEVAHLQAKIALLARHVCPRVDIEAESRDGLQLLSELWCSLLRLRLHQYKDRICASVAEGKQCSHLSIQSGLMQYGFYVSHAEALNLIREIAGATEASEDRVVSLDSFQARLINSQPYPLEEDVAGSLRCISVLFSLQNLTVNKLKNELSAQFDLMKLLQRLRPFCKEMPVEKLKRVCGFLLRGQCQVAGATISQRLCEALPQWWPFIVLRERKGTIKEVLLRRQGLTKVLREHKGALQRQALRRLWQRFGEELDAQEEQLLVVKHVRHALRLGFEEPLKRLVQEVSLRTLQKWSCAADLQPVPSHPMRYLEEEEEES